MTTENLRFKHGLVTGATGFIGSRLVRRLRGAGVRVRAIGRSRVPADADESIRLDLTAGPIDAALFEDIDVVFHLAAKTHDMAEAADADEAYARINVDGTRHVVDAARAARVPRVVFVSSVKALDEGGPDQHDESHSPEPTTGYGRSKLAAERLVLEAAASGGPSGVCLRFPLVYGPGQRGNLTRMIAAVDRGRFPPPPDNGNRRSMLHVENAVDALLLAAAHDRAAGQVYLVTDAEAYSTRQLYDWLREALGKPPATWSVPAWVFRALAAVGDAARTVARRRIGFDSDAFQKLLGSAWYSPEKIGATWATRPRARCTARCPISSLITAGR